MKAQNSDAGDGFNPEETRSPQGRFCPKGEFVDLRDHYFAHRSWFFGAAFGSAFFSLAKDVALYGRLPAPIDSIFLSIFGLAAIAGAITRNEWFHKLMVPAMSLLFLLYIALLFARL